MLEPIKTTENILIFIRYELNPLNDNVKRIIYEYDPTYFLYHIKNKCLKYTQHPIN